jgi:Flp pilus assembly protein TadG
MDSKRPLSFFRRRLREFGAARGGNVAIVFALATVPIMGAVGAAVDYSRANAMRATMQAAIDATTLMLAKKGASLSSAQMASQASAYFTANFTGTELKDLVATAVPGSAPAGPTINGSATGKIGTQIMRVMGIETITITVRAVALGSASGTGCVFSLNPVENEAIKVAGSANVNLVNCSLYDNSNDAQALYGDGASKLSALSVGVVGGLYNGNNNIVATQGISTSMAPLTDPYANDSFPPPSGSCQNQAAIQNTQTLSPGFRCGLRLNAGANVTLNPGIYYVGKDGLTVNGQATLSGTGVTLVFTSSGGNYGDAVINGGAVVNLTAPTTGPTAGIVIFGDRAMPTGTQFRFNGGATQSFGGAVYVPKGKLEYSGGSASSSSCTQLIANTVKFTGNSDVALNCSGYGTKSFGSTTVRLIS